MTGINIEFHNESSLNVAQLAEQIHKEILTFFSLK
jgi:hypothetical protein